MLERFTLDGWVVLDHCVTLAIAYLLALPIAWDREQAERTAGLRTFPIVALAACGFTLTGFELLDSTDAEARVVQGLITGIGFIGGGAILKQDDGMVRGTATAASLWATGAIGLAVAGGRLEIAVPLSLTTFATLHFLNAARREADD